MSSAGLGRDCFHRDSGGTAYLIDVGTQVFDRVGRRDGDREDETFRTGPAGGVQSRLHRRAGGDAVVDQDCLRTR
jgi:hypothetical protein